MNENYIKTLNIVPLADVICFLSAIEKECVVEDGMITGILRSGEECE